MGLKNDQKTVAERFWQKAIESAKHGDVTYLGAAMDQLNRVDEEIIFQRQRQSQIDLEKLPKDENKMFTENEERVRLAVLDYLKYKI